MPSSKQGVLLNSLEDVAVAEGLGLMDGTLLLTTHAAIKRHLRVAKGKDSRMLGEFSDMDELQVFRRQAHQLVDKVVAGMDNRYSRTLCDHFSLPPFELFRSRYSYIPKESCVFAALTCSRLIPRIFAAEGLRGLTIFELREPRAETALFSLHDLVPLLDPGLPVNVLGPDLPPYDPSGICARQAPTGREPLPADRPGVVYFANYYDGFALNDKLKGLTRIVYHQGYLYPEGLVPPEEPAPAVPDIFAPVQPGGGLESLFEEKIIENCRRFGPEFQALQVLNTLAEKLPVLCAYWDVAPVQEFRSVVYADLMALGLPVLGMQHGASYGEQVCPQHYHADFTRCTHYVSYGFDADDLGPSLGTNGKLPTIHPLGTLQFQNDSSPEPKERIDLLYIPANSMSELRSGLIRKPAHELADLQAAIADFLRGLGLTYAVKLPMWTSAENSALRQQLEETLERAQYTDIPLDDWLKTRQPRAVILDFPSTPLYRVLPLDAEIFLVTDESAPYHAKARALLARRVHLCQGTEDLCALVAKWQSGRLEAKRDDGFLRHYLRQDNTAGQVEKLILDIAAGRA